MEEVWKDVAGYEGIYQISNMGRVYSLPRKEKQRCQYGGYIERPWGGKLIKPHDNGNGYLYVTLRKNGVRKNFYIHRLVATAFVDNPNGDDYVNHIDYNIRNNMHTNLEWCTQRENILHSVPNMRKPHNNKLPSTGERYICLKNGCYVFTYKKKHIKCFKTLEEAVAFRNQFLQEAVS